MNGIQNLQHSRQHLCQALTHKLLRHNIFCLFQVQFELGIEPVFWKEVKWEAVAEANYLLVKA